DWEAAGGKREKQATICALPRGSCLDDFEVQDEVGRGGMGIVYRARQKSLNRDVALKVLPPALCRRGSTLRRFRTEAQAVARLKHPNVVPIYAQGEYDGHLYYAMELIDGVSLDVAIHSHPEVLTSTFWRTRSFPLSPPRDELYSGKSDGGARIAEDEPTLADAAPPPRTVEDFRHIARLVAGAADGLAHAGEQGVIHRDIKPHNLLLGTDGLLHITDFGLAHLTDEPHLTMGGELMGTAAYLSPEQVRGDPHQVDHRADIYSLGATLYELITRRRPFEGNTRDQILSGICTSEPPRPRRSDRRIPRDLETICLRAMEKDPARRYSSAGLMAEELRRFADDRPILSRRAGPLETSLRLASRHRAVAAAIAAIVVAFVLALRWMQSADSSRHAEAARLLQSAYERLAYENYRMPDLAADKIERAEELGADQIELGLTRALADLGNSDNLSAVERLQAVLAQSPNDTRALYMLAWAQRRAGDTRASHETFTRAETLGGPARADAWFFRGLAMHFDRPDIAVQSYREANTLRTQQHEFYPQAVLHLARAHNQEMYVSRKAEVFAEAEFSLRQLIEHKNYGSYPYYLLSIAHRLAAEIQQTEAAAPDGSISNIFAEALGWARAGQREYPADERPVTAEAECLESLGRFDEAIEARSRAIGLAKRPVEQWEGNHYRWRLHYWLSNFAEALADLEACRGFSPNNRFYEFLYPALIYAEIGQMQQARELARRIAELSSNDAQAVLWSSTALRLLGRQEEADALLRSRMDSVDYAAALVPPQSQEWIGLLYAYCLGEAQFGELLALAEGLPSARKLLGEAYFHAGAKALGEGNRELAFTHFVGAYQSFDGEQAYAFHGKAVWEKMRAEPGWPPWLQPATDPQGQH
ncbi:MAG: protein kinase, partial [Planctomycetota bacterium]